LATIKSGRATADIFDDLQVKAYGDQQDWSEVCQTIVRGTSSLTVKIYDPSVKDEVVKALNQADLDIEIAMEGKDIKVKMGQARKEHQQEAVRKAKAFAEEYKKSIRKER